VSQLSARIESKTQKDLEINSQIEDLTSNSQIEDLISNQATA
jgi:hypothetical protein